MASGDKKLGAGDIIPDHDYSTISVSHDKNVIPKTENDVSQAGNGGVPDADIRKLIQGVVTDMSKEQLVAVGTVETQVRSTRRKKSNNPKHINAIQIKDKPIIVKHEVVPQLVKIETDTDVMEVVISKRIRKPNPKYKDEETTWQIERSPPHKVRKSPAKRRRRSSAIAAVSSEEEDEEEEETEKNEEEVETEEEEKSADENEEENEEASSSEVEEEEEEQPEPEVEPQTPSRRGRPKRKPNQPHLRIVEKFMKMKGKSNADQDHTIRIYVAGDQMLVTEKDIDGNVLTYQYSPSYEKNSNRKLRNTASFVCKLCQLDFALKENLENHLMNVHGTSAANEDAVSTENSVIEEDTTLDHETLSSMVQQAGVFVSYQCDNCQGNFPNLKRLERHCMRNDCKEPTTGDGNLACPTCGKYFRYKSLLKLHHYTHTGEKPFKCDYCGQKFAQPGNLNKHLRTSHNELPKKLPSAMKCKSCKHLFSTNANYDAHLEPVVKSCRFCYKILTNNCKLSQHLKKNHPESGDKKNGGFVCNHCSRCFDYQAQLTVHERVHTGTKPFICDICEKGFSQKGNLNVHMKMHFPKEMQSEKRFQCQYCSKMFPHRPHLEVHLRIHQGIKPFRCDVCGKAFTQRGNLNVHHKIHTGEKNFPCNECGKSFSYRPQLLVHSRIHTGAKPYVCKYCQKQFSQAGNLNVHIKAVHNPEKGVVVRRAKTKKLQTNMIHTYETSDESDDDDDEEDDDVEVRPEYHQIIPTSGRNVLEIDPHPQAIPQEFEVVTSPTETVVETTVSSPQEVSGVTVVTDADGNEYQLMTDQNMKVYQLQNVSGSLQLVTTDQKQMNSVPVYISNSDEVPSGAVYEVVVSS